MLANPHSVTPSGGAGDVSPTENLPGTSANPKMRKRTKTGCLTCRKRRIKCGEERPTCNNCIKSKRQCEGYNQRVVFKTPIENWPNHPGHVTPLQYHTSMLPGTRNQPYRPPQSAAQESAHSIQPRPLNAFDFTADPNPSPGIPTSQQMLVGGTPSYIHDPSYQQPLVSPHHQQPLQSPHHLAHTPAAASSYFPQQSPIQTSPPMQYMQEPTASYQAPHPYSQNQPPYQQTSSSYENNGNIKPTAPLQPLTQQPLYQQQHQSTSQPEEHSSYHSPPSVSPRSDVYPSYPESRPVVQRYNSLPQVATQRMQANSADISQAGPYNFPAAISHTDFNHSSFSSVHIPNFSVAEEPEDKSRPPKPQAQLALAGFGGEDHVSPTQILDEAAVEIEDDDYWDVHSDEEMADADDGEIESRAMASEDFSIIRQIHMENSNELGVRRYDTFLYDGMLSQYRPEYTASPLRNPKTARVFAHFIHVTGPTLSIYERNPRNSTLIFEGPTPAVQQGLWTYILPLKALGHQGLLHAMLALASLHIARLQGASITPSYKHYAYALKRLHRSLSHSKKRLTTSTLATSLLLAYYEVWTAEHVKWSTHLVGAAQLLTELNFRSLTREARRLRAAHATQIQQFSLDNPGLVADQTPDQGVLEKMPDAMLVSTIVGKQVNYDDFGMVFEDNGDTQETKPKIPGSLDLKSFETFQDLYWWYTRHDVLQSIVSGNSLIMPYRKWSDCPPRAPFGRTDALYGTNDHVLLLLGRIADFSFRDRERKLRQVEADGGWRPRPGMPGMGPPPSGQTTPGGQPPTPTTPQGPPPHMQGPPPGWSGPPPPGWKGPAPPGFGPPSDGPPKPAPGGPPPTPPAFFGMAPAAPNAPLPASYANPSYKHSPPTPNAPHPKYADLPAAYNDAVAEWDDITAAHTIVAQLLTNTDGFGPLPFDNAPPVPGQKNTSKTPFGPPLSYRSYDISIIWTFVHLAKIILLRSHPAMPPAAHMAAGICAPATGPYANLIGRITAGMQIPLRDDLSPFLGAVLTESTMSLFFAGIQFQDPTQREWLITRLLEIDRRTGWASAGIIARGCETSWEKAAQMGRGPPYTRRTRRAGEEGPLVLDLDEEDGPGTWRRKERDDFGKGLKVGTYKAPREEGDGAVRRASSQWTMQTDEEGNQERGYVIKTRMATWAMNLLGTEEDLRQSMERVGI